MLKEDVKVEKWSSMRGLDRTDAPMAFRFSPVERKAIEVEAAAHLVRPSDVVRGCLIYAGVIEEPTPETKAEGVSDLPEQEIGGES